MPTRAEQKAETRARLLDAAAVVIAAKGVEGASVDAIAAAAGVTSGAVYASFKGKTDLLLALAAERSARLATGAVADVAPEVGRQVSAYAGESPVDAHLLVQLLSAASRDDALREAMAARIRSSVRALAARMDDEGTVTALPAERTAVLVQLLAAGALVLKPVLGDDLPDDLLAEVATLLFPEETP